MKDAASSVVELVLIFFGHRPRFETFSADSADVAIFVDFLVAKSATSWPSFFMSAEIIWSDMGNPCKKFILHFAIRKRRVPQKCYKFRGGHFMTTKSHLSDLFLSEYSVSCNSKSCKRERRVRLNKNNNSCARKKKHGKNF